MTKLLNIDKLIAAPATREIVLNGKTHQVTPFSVDNFIQTSIAAEKAGEMNVREQIEETVNMIMRCVPDADRSFLGKLPLEHLQLVMKFIRGDDDIADEAVEGGPGNE